MTHETQLDPSARAIVNAGFDKSNILSMEESLPRIRMTLDKCQKILKEHCGPQAGYAMLVENMTAGIEYRPNIFTRDGIGILKSVEFMSPMERYIKDMLTYIGSRVDSAAKDGTTTSMLFAALFLNRVFDKLDELHACGLSFFQMNKAIEALFNKIIESLETYAFSIERTAKSTEIDEEVKVRTAGLVAFMQALSSSGGNVELAIAMKEIFEKSPSVAWDFISSRSSIKETESAFKVEVCEYDYRIKAITALEGILTKALNSEYEAEDVEIIVLTTSTQGNEIRSEKLIQYLRNSEDKNIIVIAPAFDGRLTGTAYRLNAQREHKIALWQFSPEHKLAGVSYSYELLGLAAVSKIEIPFDMDESTDELLPRHIAKAKKVVWHDTYLEFYGLYERTDNNLHPFYSHPETATGFYNDVRRALEHQLSLYKEGHKAEGNMSSVFLELLNRIACVHRPTLRLGGQTHEQQANADVVKDVQGAIMSSLNNGFLINGPISIFRAIMDTCEYYETLTVPEGNAHIAKVLEFQNIIVNAMAECGEDILSVVYGTGDDYPTMDMYHTPDIYYNSLSKDNQARDYWEFIERIKTVKDINNLSEEALELGVQYPVLQPKRITIELLKRIKELLMKFVNTNKIVVYGGVVIKEENK
jgi:hypothetical protein